MISRIICLILLAIAADKPKDSINITSGDMASCEAAIKVANAQGGKCRIVIPSGEWKWPQADLPVITTPNVSIEGTGNTRLHLTGGTYFKWASTSWVEGGGLKNLQIIYDKPVTDPAPCCFISFGAGQQFFDIDYRLGGSFLQCGDQNGSCSRTTLDRCDVMMRNLGWPAVRLSNGTGFNWRDSRTFTDTPAPTWPVPGVPPSQWPAMASLPGQDMLLIDGSWDTCNLTRLTSMRWHRGINISPKSDANILLVSAENCTFDYIRENAVFVNLSPKASLNSLIIDGGLYDTWEGDCFSLSGKTLVSPSIRGVRVLFSGRSAVRTGQEKILGLTMTSNIMSNTSRLAPGIPALSLGPLERANIQANTIGGSDRYPWGDVNVGIFQKPAAMKSMIQNNLITTKP